MTTANLERICPFFIVKSVFATIEFYRAKLGFDVLHQEPAQDPFFAILGRDGVMIFVKSGSVEPAPNPSRDPEMRWDSYIATNDPGTLATEFEQRGAAFSSKLADTHDGLRGFEVTDPDGYVLFFGRPG